MLTMVLLRMSCYLSFLKCPAVFFLGGGHWGLRYCGIGQFFMRYFGNFNFKLRYCGILQNLRDEVFLAFLSTIFD